MIGSGRGFVASMPLWLVAAAALALGVGPASAQESSSTLDGVYTDEQAERGRATYARTCSQCHTLDWYTGDLMKAWAEAPVFNLFEVISTTMPEDNPGSLPRRDYVDMIAYILKLNGMPPGDAELSTGASRLRQILFRWSTGS